MNHTKWGVVMFLFFILVVVLIATLIGSLPTWPRSKSWGYFPSGGVGLILLALVILFLPNHF